MGLGAVKKQINDELLRRKLRDALHEPVVKNKSLKDSFSGNIKYSADKLFASNHLHTEGLVDSITISTFSSDVTEVTGFDKVVQKGIQETLAKTASIVGDQTDGKTFGGIIQSRGNVDGAVGVCKLVGNFGLTGVTRPNVKCISSGAPKAIADSTTKIEALVNTTRVDVATFLDSLPEVIGKPSQGFLSIVLKVAKELGVTDAIMSSVSPFGDITKGFNDFLMNSPIGGVVTAINDGLDFASETLDTVAKDLTGGITGAFTDAFPAPTKLIGTGFIQQTVPDPTKFNLGGFLSNLAEETIKQGTGMLRSMVAQQLPFGEEIKLLNALAAGGRQANEALLNITLKDGDVQNLILDGRITPELVKKATGNDSLAKVLTNIEEGMTENGASAADIAALKDKVNANKLRVDNEFRTTLSAILASEARISPLNSDFELEIARPFTYVSSVEELDFEMANKIHSIYTNREINNVVIHATETFTNKNIGAEEIDSIQKILDGGKQGKEYIGYHYVIRRDGRLQRGIPLTKKGNHTETGNYNETSIGIAMVGGILSPATEGSWQTSSASFTREQYNTLEQFLGVFYHHVAGGEVFGHNDINPDELDPYFDVQEYILSLFGKVNESFVESPESEQTPIFIPDPTLLNISDIDLKASGKFEVKYAKQNTNKKFVDPDLLRDDIPRRLELIANTIGRNLIVTSGYRTQAQGDAIGSSRKSRHRTGQAVDVSRDGMSNAQLQSLIEAAIAAGFRGIGVYNGHLHFDTGTKKCWGPTGSRKSLAGSKFAFARSVLNAFKYTTA
jgi:N-acetylmuramoyl-L-alanine amidase